MIGHLLCVLLVPSLSTVLQPTTYVGHAAPNTTTTLRPFYPARSVECSLNCITKYRNNAHQRRMCLQYVRTKEFFHRCVGRSKLKGVYELIVPHEIPKDELQRFTFRDTWNETQREQYRMRDRFISKGLRITRRPSVEKFIAAIKEDVVWVPRTTEYYINATFEGQHGILYTIFTYYLPLSLKYIHVLFPFFFILSFIFLICYVGSADVKKRVVQKDVKDFVGAMKSWISHTRGRNNGKISNN